MEGQVIKTDWFDGTVKPARTGVYERAMPWGDDEFAKWDGKNWINAATTIEAAAQRTGVSHYQERPWRGVVPEVHGCVPVHAPDSKGCQGCAFDGPGVVPNPRCSSAIRAVSSCAIDSIIWRPRSEVTA